MVVIPALLLYQAIFNVKDADPIDGKGTRQPLLPQQTFDTPARCPLHGYMTVRGKLSVRSVGNGGCHAKAAREPSFNLFVAPALALHAGIEKFCVLCVEGNEVAHLVLVEGINPAMYYMQAFCDL